MVSITYCQQCRLYSSHTAGGSSLGYTCLWVGWFCYGHMWYSLVSTVWRDRHGHHQGDLDNWVGHMPHRSGQRGYMLCCSGSTDLYNQQIEQCWCRRKTLCCVLISLFWQLFEYITKQQKGCKKTEERFSVIWVF